MASAPVLVLSSCSDFFYDALTMSCKVKRTKAKTLCPQVDHGHGVNYSNYEELVLGNRFCFDLIVTVSRFFFFKIRSLFLILKESIVDRLEFSGS